MSDPVLGKTSPKILLVVAAALVDTDNRVLVAKRGQSRDMAGLWEFPGGKVEASETPEAALVRELKEELDIEVCARCLAPLTFVSHAYEKFHILMPLFVCRNWQGEIKALEHEELKWVRPVRLADFDMPPADMPLKAALRDLL